MNENYDEGWRWKNVPIPEAHLILIGVGVVLGFVWPSGTVLPAWLLVVGWLLVVSGILLGAWATSAAGIVDLESPDSLVTAGPYAFSRHPMYIAWTLIFTGLGLVLGNLWFAALLPILLVIVHLETGSEEKRLEAAFGEEYDSYRTRVRRYL